MKRLLTAGVLIPVVLAAVFWMPGRWFFWAVGGVVLLAALEFAAIARHWAPALNSVTLSIGVAFVAVSLGRDGLFPGGLEPFLMVVVGLLAAGGLALLPGVRTHDVLPHAGALAFGSLYLGVPWVALTVLKHHDEQWVFLLLVTVWLSDSGAYYAGRAFGRRKLAPVVSPNKTWEGAIGGAFAAVAGGAGWSLWQVGVVDPMLLVWILGVAVAGQLGDLFESKIKRGAEVKDSGSLLPGHGGVLDRIDALLFSAPLLACGLVFASLGTLLD